MRDGNGDGEVPGGWIDSDSDSSDPHEAEKPFNTAYDLLAHIAETLRFIVSFAYAPELLQAAEARVDGRLDPGNLAELLALGARIEARIGGDDDA